MFIYLFVTHFQSTSKLNKYGSSVHELSVISWWSEYLKIQEK